MVQEMRGVCRRRPAHARLGSRPAISSTSLVRVASMNCLRSWIGTTKAPGPADHAVLVVDVEIFDIHGAAQRPLEHDRQAVDGDAGREHVVARRHDQRAGIVGAVARHVDHAAQAAVAAVVEQRLGEFEPAGNRRARGAPVRRGARSRRRRFGRFRAFDQPPRHDDLLVELRRPIRNR